MNRRIFLCGAAILIVCLADAPSASADEAFADALWTNPTDSSTRQASYFQPPMPQDDVPDDDSIQPTPLQPVPQPRTSLTPTPRLPTDTTWRRSSLSRRPVVRLASIPKMFGDFGIECPMMEMMNQGMTFSTDLASGGIGQRLKALENNNAWPDDRIDFLYRHYHNSLRATPQLSSPNVNKFPIDTYTFSYERTFIDGLTSVQLLMPFQGTPTVRATGAGFPNNFVDGGNIGNFGMIFKCLLYENGNFAFASGMSLNTPTGSGLNGRAFDSTFYVHNEAFQLAPFGAFLWSPDEPWLSNFFVQGGIQYDMVTGGNTLTVFNPTAGFNGDLMELVDPNLLFSDLVFGAFLYQNPSAPILTGIVGQVELHHAWSTDPNFVRGTVGMNQFVFGRSTDRIDALNITGGLRIMLLGNTVLSVGGVAPLNAPLFDAEVQAVTSIFL